MPSAEHEQLVAAPSADDSEHASAPAPHQGRALQQSRSQHARELKESNDAGAPALSKGASDVSFAELMQMPNNEKENEERPYLKLEELPPFEYVLSFRIENNGKGDEEAQNRIDSVVERLRHAGLICVLTKNVSEDVVFVKVTATIERLRVQANHMRVKYLMKPIPLEQEEEEESTFLSRTMGAVLGGTTAVATSAVTKLLGFVGLSLQDPYLAQRRNDKELVNLYSEYSLVKEDVFVDGGEHNLYSRRRQQLVLNIIESPKPMGAELDTKGMLSRGELEQIFPLHHPEEQKALRKNWGNTWRFWKRQPLEDIRNYFGEKVAFYFLWLGFYTNALWFPGAIGLLFTFWQAGESKTNLSSIPYFCIFLAVWSTLLLEFWKRRQSEYAHIWGVEDYKHRERNRSQFSGKLHYNPFIGKHEYFYPSWKRGLKYGVSYPFLFAGAGLIVAVVIGIFKIRKSIEDNVPNSMRNYIIGIITAISINVLNVIFRPIARILNDWENHRTESAWERHLILKLYTFSFINNFITLFYLAFIEPIDAGRTTQTGLNPHPNKTMGDLSAQLGTIMITKQVLSNFMEIGLPWIQRQLTKFILRRKYEREERDAKQLTKLEKQHKMPYFDLFEEFQEIAIQFGYVTLFAAAFPAAPLWALINNVFEIRIDAFNLVSQQKRPPWNRAADIGAWYNILEVTAFLSVFTNSMIIGYSSGQVTSQWGLSGEDAVWALFLVEHIVFVVKFVVMGMIPDTPKWVEKETSGISRWRERKLLTDVLNDENRAEIDLSAMVPRYEGEGTSAHDAVAEPAGFYADGAPMPDRA